jgi:putative sterol carrier protein
MAINIIDEREEWITEWKQKVNTESTYHDTGAGWGVDFNGNFLFEVEPDAAYDDAIQYTDDDITDGTAFFAEISDGEVHSATNIAIDELDQYDYGFNYHGTYSNWKGLINQEIGPIDGLMSGQFAVDGDMQKILQWSDGAVDLASSAGLVDTIFPDEET